MSGTLAVGRGWAGRGVSAGVVLGLLAGALAGTGTAARAAAGGHRAATGVISTVAGGVGGPALGTKVGLEPCGVMFGSGSLYVGDTDTVRTVNPGTGWLTTPAGTGSIGPLGVGGLAAKAGLNGACAMEFDRSGNLLITANQSVELVAAASGTFYGQPMIAGHIYTVAGISGSGGYSGDGGPATSAKLGDPAGVAVDAAGNLVIADTDNNRIRVVAASTGTLYGQRMTAGDIYTVAGTGQGGYSGDGGRAISAKLHHPQEVAVDGAGNLVIADATNDRIRVVAAAAGTFYGQPMTTGDIYTVAGTGVRGFSGNDGPATSAELHGPGGVLIDGAGNLVIADTGNNQIRVVAAAAGTFYGQPMTAGDIYAVAGTGVRGFSGNGGPATSARLYHPDGVAADGAGNLVIADTGNRRVRVVAAAAGPFYGQPMTAGDIYTVAGNGSTGFSGDGGPATHAQFGNPDGVAANGAGNVLIPDAGDNRVRVAAASTGMSYGRPMTAEHIYTVAGNGHAGSSGDGGPATSAELSGPAGVAADGAGNLVIADTGNNRIRLVAASTGMFYGQPMTAGDIYTVAGTGVPGFAGDGGPATSAELNGPIAVAVDGAGNVLIADGNNFRIRVVAAKSGTFYGQAMTAGNIYTVAGSGVRGFAGDGGPATSAEFSFLGGVAGDGAGNLVIADTDNNRVRVVAGSTGTFYGLAMTAGDIYTVAGTGVQGFSGDGGPAISAELGTPGGVAVDGAGNLVIADTNNNRVRVVAGSTGTFYGQPMTAGDIYTVAGTGVVGFSGDGGPATDAEFWDPGGVAVNGAADLLIADTGNGRIRLVSG